MTVGSKVTVCTVRRFQCKEETQSDSEQLATRTAFRRWLYYR